MSLSVIIPSKNVRNLMACITALRSCEPSARIVVIDDGLDISFRMELLTPAQFITGIKPFIFSRNVNLGIKAAGHDDVIVLGDDGLLCTDGGFTLLQRAAEEHPEFGIISSSCNTVGNANQFPHDAGLREDPRMVCFVAVLIPRRTIDLVGLLDERFTAYGYEDDDYCLRIRRAGLKIGIHDGCFVDHGTLPSTFRSNGGAALDGGAEIFRRKWGAENHAL